MTLHPGWLAVLLAGIAGCEIALPLRQACDEDAAPESCCPPGSHRVVNTLNTDVMVCGPDEDAGAGDGACDDAGTDAH